MCCERRPSDRLVQQVHAVLRNALQAAVREELVQRNVAKLAQVAGGNYEVNRGLTVDQDNVNTRLVSGKNTILVKCLNGGSQWGFCLRITDRQGAPLPLPEREK